jgi:hypothetical protein
MKRAFLFGLGSFFIVGIIAGLQEMFVGHEMVGPTIPQNCAIMWL